MSLETSSAKLNTAAKDFCHTWQHVRGRWRDRRAAAFEETFVRELERSVKGALTALAHMDGMLARAQRECG